MTSVTVVFLKFPKLPERAKNAAYFGHSNAKNLSASGSFAPWPGALPLDSVGLRSPCVPRIGALGGFSAPKNNFSLRPGFIHSFIYWINPQETIQNWGKVTYTENIAYTREKYIKISLRYRNEPQFHYLPCNLPCTASLANHQLVRPRAQQTNP